MHDVLQRVDRGLDRLAARPPLALLACCVLSLILFLPGFATLPPIDRDEALFSQASRQMVATGDLIDIRLGEGTRYKKPVGIYWLQSATLSVLGPEFENTIWAYRLPSLAAAIGAVGLTFLLGLTLSGPPVAMTAGVLVGACFLLGGEARLAKTDATLLATILAAQLVLARLHMNGREAIRGTWAYVFWAALGASILVKGPIGVMVVGLTVATLAAFRREIRWLGALRPLRGLALMLAIALPWYVAITFQAGEAFWAESLGRDLLGKIGEGQESHGAPPGVYTLAVWLTFWPAAILLPFGLWHAWVDRKSPAVLYCLAAILPTWLVFEFTATKLIHYVLPTYPMLAVLTAMGWHARTGPPGLPFRIYSLAALALAVLFAGVALRFAIGLGGGPTAPWGLGLLLTITGIAVTWQALRRDLRWIPLLGIVILSLGFGFGSFAHLARVDALWPSVRMASIARDAPTCAAPRIVSVGYDEPSLYLLTERLPVFARPKDAVPAALEADCAVIFVTEPRRPGLERALGDTPFTRLEPFKAFSLGNAREIEVTTFILP